jgi:hypothetical protein
VPDAAFGSGVSAVIAVIAIYAKALKPGCILAQFARGYLRFHLAVHCLGPMPGFMEFFAELDRRGVCFPVHAIFSSVAGDAKSADFNYMLLFNFRPAFDFFLNRRFRLQRVGCHLMPPLAFTIFYLFTLETSTLLVNSM